MPTPKFYDVRLTQGPLVLCAACVAVLVQEGTVAGDPREEAVPAHDVVRMAPRAVLPSDPSPPTCDTCSTREAYEAELNAAWAADDVPSLAEIEAADEEDSARRWAEAYLPTCEDVAFGTPEEHTRWHAIHDTPTLREVEGDDTACEGDGERYCNREAETYCDRHEEELRRYLESTPF